AELGQVIGHRTARDAAANDDHAGLVRDSRAHARILSFFGSHNGWSGCTVAGNRSPNISTSSSVPGSVRSARSIPSAIDLPIRWPQPPEVVSPTTAPLCQSVDI